MVPFTIATGTMQFAQNLFIRVHTNQGLSGVGECSAFPMIAGETQDTCFVLARDFATLWKGKNAADIHARMQELDSYITHNHTAKSAFDMALYDLAAKAKGVPLYQFFGGSYWEPESDLTIGIGAAEDMAAQAVEFVEQRMAGILKVKLGKHAGQDIERMQKIRAAVGPQVELRIDANAGWNFEDAVLALTALQPLNIAFCEQPMPRLLDDKMPSLRRLSQIPIMADESVFNHHEAERLLRANACDYVNIKLSKAGGLAEAWRIHDVCASYQIPNMIGGMLESRLALTAKVHFALAAKNVQFYDLDTCLLGHLEDPVTGGVVFKGMKLQAPNVPGIGADIDPVWLKKCEHITI